MEKLIGLLPARPSLWQKSHPDFQNRNVRDALLREIANELGATVGEVKERLKNVKDYMRKHVHSLPKTKSGAPAFEMASQITWPHFKKLLFMKDEFIGRKLRSSYPEYAQCSEQENDNHACDDINKQNDEENVSQRALEDSGIPSAESRSPSCASTTSSEGLQLKRNKTKKSCSENIEQEKLKLLKESLEVSKQKMERNRDPLDLFVMDLANDLKQIEDKKLLVQTKLELKQITSKALLKQMDTACAEGVPDVQQTDQMDI